jgi:hypothetical protein
MVGLARSVVLDERSNAACAVASSPGRVRLAWTGTDTRLNVLTSADGRVFGDKHTLPFRSYIVEHDTDSDGHSTSKTVALAPALATNDDGDHLVWTEYPGRLVWYAFGGHGGGGLGEHTTDPPALAGRGRDMWVGWTGTDRRLNLRSIEGGHWGQKWTLDETSAYAPAVCASATELALAWTGTDRHLNVMVTRGGQWGAPVRLEETSSDPPALCPRGDRFALAWTGADRRINVLAFGPDGASPAEQLDATSPHAPSLCPLGDATTLAAWTGSDRRLNLAILY